MTRSASRVRRALAAVLVAAVPVLASACTAYRAVGPGAEAATSAPVRVYFAEPRRLPVVAVSGDTTMLDGVSEITGDLVAVSGDTLAVRVRSLNRGAATSGATVRFARRPADRVESRRADVPSTIAMVLIVGVLLVGAITVIAVSEASGY